MSNKYQELKQTTEKASKQMETLIKMNFSSEEEELIKKILSWVRTHTNKIRMLTLYFYQASSLT